MPLRSTRLQLVGHAPAARGESLAAFDGRCILAGCVAPPLNTPGILGRRALPARRLARLGATPHFHHGLLSARRLAHVDEVKTSVSSTSTCECVARNFGRND